MGERKGTNKYYPPDYDPKIGGLNKFRGTHALRERARKIHLGIIIVRFEMPYNIWCEGCNNHIGMGVRYNAEKKKVGMYYSTPVYQFRMKCHLCDNHFEIKTDPGNLDYVVVNGARRQENRWDPTQNEQVVPETRETSRKLFDDAMFKLEHKNNDANTSKKSAASLNKLLDRQESVWKDDFAANSILRAKLRAGKKERLAVENANAAVSKRLSINIPLLAQNEEDNKLASLLMLKQSIQTPKTKSGKNRSESYDKFDETSATKFQPSSSKTKPVSSLVSDMYGSDSSSE
ncbi:coiled-coil domain-containing protein 130 homolog [Planococcus citri]|uniref:coiled-coil domain-containing protein 130 homolog n=1 Tax=Planococcus citri TaxID=170843 RepID=UPI0031FA0235